MSLMPWKAGFAIFATSPAAVQHEPNLSYLLRNLTDVSWKQLYEMATAVSRLALRRALGIGCPPLGSTCTDVGTTTMHSTETCIIRKVLSLTCGLHQPLTLAMISSGEHIFLSRPAKSNPIPDHQDSTAETDRLGYVSNATDTNLDLLRTFYSVRNLLESIHGQSG